MPNDAFNSDAVTAAAAALMQARRSRRLIPALPEALRPRDAAGAYAIQSAYVAARGGEAVGHKIGCTSERAQRSMGLSEPFAGVVLKPGLTASPARLIAGAFNQRIVESEFAFLLARDLDQAPYDLDQVASAVAAMHPAIEVVDSAFADLHRCGALAAIADNGCHGALVLGPRSDNWRNFDLARHPVRLSFGDKPISEGTGSEALGHPLQALAWLANALAGRGDRLRQGEIVSTGTCTGVNVAPVGIDVLADFGPLGKVHLRFDEKPPD